LGIAARPKLLPDLKTGNFPARTYGPVVIATFNHGKRRPAIHSRAGRYKSKASQKQDGQSNFHNATISSTLHNVNRQLIY